MVLRFRVEGKKEIDPKTDLPLDVYGNSSSDFGKVVMAKLHHFNKEFYMVFSVKLPDMHGNVYKISLRNP